MDRWHSRLPVWHGSHPISAEPASPGCRQRVVVEALDELRPATHSPGLNAPQPDAGLEPEFLFEPGILSRHEGVSVEFAIGQKTYACVTIPLRSWFSERRLYAIEIGSHSVPFRSFHGKTNPRRAS